MQIGIIGTGYVGLVSGACFAALGHNVVCIDNDPTKVAALASGIIPIFEPGLEDLVREQTRAGRLYFGSSYNQLSPQTELIIVAVGTPSSPSGEADLRYVFHAIDEIAEHIKHPCVVVLKSTVPVGTNAKVQAIFLQKGCTKLKVVSNPEFLREGTAIDDFMQPDRIVIGTDDVSAQSVLRKTYLPLVDRGVAFITMSNFESAELCKYAANAYLTMRVSFINEIADLCDKVGGDILELVKGLGADKRIGSHYLKPGPGFGGSCFPKDSRAIDFLAKSFDLDMPLMDAMVRSNQLHKERMASLFEHYLPGGVKGKTLAILGLTFKANTDDMRESASLTILPELAKRGACLRCYDPEGMEEAKKMLPRSLVQSVTWCQDGYDAASGADAIIVLTEWKEFTSLDPSRLRKYMRQAYLLDARHIMPAPDFANAGFVVWGLGCPVLEPLLEAVE